MSCASTAHCLPRATARGKQAELQNWLRSQNLSSLIACMRGAAFFHVLWWCIVGQRAISSFTVFCGKGCYHSIDTTQGRKEVQCTLGPLAPDHPYGDHTKGRSLCGIVWTSSQRNEDKRERQLFSCCAVICVERRTPALLVLLVAQLYVSITLFLW